MHVTKLLSAMPFSAIARVAVITLGLSIVGGSGWAGSISVGDATGRNNYLGSLNNMVSGLTSLSDFYLARSDGQTTGITLNYNPGEDTAKVTGVEGFTAADADWARPLAWAERYDHDEIVTLLREVGATA